MSLLIATLVLWVFFIFTAKIAQGAESRDDLNKIQLIVVYIFAAVDVFYNFTYGAVLFWEPASFKRKLLTSRIKHYLKHQPGTWRGKLARFMCKYMINPHDPGHCDL